MNSARTRLLSVQGYYRDKTLLITGGTGFIGSILLKIILAKLPDIRRVYCLYRTSVGVTDPRVVWIKGDIRRPQWGLDADALLRIRAEVHVIFHLAAHTGWEISLNEQVSSNTLPVLIGAEIASDCQQLESIVVTSSYWAVFHLVHAARIGETIFQDYRAEDELTEILTGKSSARLSEWPNAYSYSKNLAERLLHQRYPDLPVILARVTSAGATWEFPERGFCHFNNALPAFLRAIVRGRAHYFPVAMKSAINDSIPADICANILLTNAADRAEEPFSVIHCGSANRNLPTLGAIAEMAGPIQYMNSAEDIDKVLSSLPNQRVANLNRLLLKTYGAGLDKRVVFLDDHARRPLNRMSVDETNRFPIEAECVDWKELVAAMVSTLRGSKLNNQHLLDEAGGHYREPLSVWI